MPIPPDPPPRSLPPALAAKFERERFWAQPWIKWVRWGVQANLVGVALLLMLPALIFIPELLTLGWWGGSLLRTVGLSMCFAAPRGPGRNALMWAGGLAILALALVTWAGDAGLERGPDADEIIVSTDVIHLFAAVLELLSLICVFRFVDWLAKALGSNDAQREAAMLIPQRMDRRGPRGLHPRLV